MFAALVIVPAAGLPGRLRAGRQRPRLRRRSASSSACSAPTSSAGAAGAHVRRHVQRHAAGDSLLHLHGADPRTLRHGRGPARYRSASCSGRCAADSAYAVVFVGALLAATTGVVAASVISMGLISLPIMLRYGYDRRARHRRHRRVGHAGADHPAEPRADHHGRPARPLGRRHVCRARSSPASCWPRSTPATSSWSRSSARRRRRRCRRKRGRSAPGVAVAARRARDVDRAPATRRRYSLASAMRCKGRRSGWRARGGHHSPMRWRSPIEALRPEAAVAAGRAGHHRPGAAAGADLPRARHDLHRRRDADRRRRHGRGRRARAGLRQAPADARSDAPGDRFHGQAVRLRRLHPDRRARVLAHLLRRQRPRLGRAPAAVCRAARSAS